MQTSWLSFLVNGFFSLFSSFFSGTTGYCKYTHFEFKALPTLGLTSHRLPNISTFIVAFGLQCDKKRATERGYLECHSHRLMWVRRFYDFFLVVTKWIIIQSTLKCCCLFMLADFFFRSAISQKVAEVSGEWFIASKCNTNITTNMLCFCLFVWW